MRSASSKGTNYSSVICMYGVGNSTPLILAHNLVQHYKFVAENDGITLFDHFLGVHLYVRSHGSILMTVIVSYSLSRV